MLALTGWSTWNRCPTKTSNETAIFRPIYLYFFISINQTINTFNETNYVNKHIDSSTSCKCTFKYLFNNFTRRCNYWDTMLWTIHSVKRDARCNIAHYIHTHIIYTHIYSNCICMDSNVIVRILRSVEWTHLLTVPVVSQSTIAIIIMTSTVTSK